MADRYPNESNEYRTAREQLLQAEMDLREQVERVASLRRSLPLGGKIKQDYVFDAPEGPLAMSALFGSGKNSLIVYSYMFTPEMPRPCTSCTSIIDGLNGQAPHVMDRVNLAVVARSPIERIMGVARQRGWNRLRLLSSNRNSYNKDYLAEDDSGEQNPMINVFAKRPDGIYHFWGTELMFAPKMEGCDGREVDMIWPLWNLFDLTPEGRGTAWYPKLWYEHDPAPVTA